MDNKVKKALQYFNHTLATACVWLFFTVNIHAQVERFDDIGKWRQPLTKNSLKDSRQLLRDYAVCKCIMQHKNKADWKRDFSISLLYEMGDYKVNAYNHIDSVTKIFVKQMHYSPLTGQKGMLLACIDYYNSKELWHIIVEMDKYIIPTPAK